MISKENRISCLDALRGLAALSVVFFHILSAYRTPIFWSSSTELGDVVDFLLNRTPLAIFHAGFEAVILFFILSGFVLALPFLSGQNPDYSTFLIRRLCRIYLPYAAALLTAVSLRSLVTIEPISGATPWLESFWMPQPTFGTAVGYLAMSGFSYHTNIDFVVWSLIHEMRISVIFPLLMAATSRGRLGIRLSVAFSFSLASNLAAHDIFGGSGVRMATHSMLVTGSYLWFFVVGIELARYRYRIGKWVAARSHAQIVALLGLSACFYCIGFLAAPFPQLPGLYFVVGIGAAGFIILAIGRDRYDRWLTQPGLLFLGRISYSLYLLHPIVLLTAVYALHTRVNSTIILTAVAPLSILAAWVGSLYIERPSMMLGRALTRHRSRRRI